jgi:hypothetical protein
MRRFVGFIALVVLMAGVTQGYEITWRTLAGGDRLFLDVGLTTPVPGAPFAAPQNPDLGGFVQLVYLGPDGIFQSQLFGDWDTADGLVGASDDEIIGSTFVGKGFILNTSGEFQTASSGVTAGLDGGGGVIGSMNFVIRFFDVASPNFPGGAVPTSGEYGYAYATAGGAYFQATAVGPTDNNNFSISNSFYTNLGPIPEPSSVALFVLGAVTLVLRRRFKK